MQKNLKHSCKRLLACLLAVVMLVGVAPIADIGGTAIKASAASNNWAWPTTTTTVSASWPKYSSGSYHSGIDFPVAVGSPVYSTCD